MVSPLTRAVIFDFYGTLGESAWTTHWLHDALAKHGYTLDRDAHPRIAPDVFDGHEHDEHSESRERYEAWVRSWWVQMLDVAGVPSDDHAKVIAGIEAERAKWEMELYPESLEVLSALRDRGLRLVLCSNWDWDLDEHVGRLGITELFDEVVCSAWLGARKPHRRMFDAATAAAKVPPGDALFVGDNVVADVEGALAYGLRAVHVWRREENPPPLPEGAKRVRDLRGILELV